MQCKKCSLDIGDKYLTCFQCKDSYHFTCLENVTENDFQFLQSSGSNWKCDSCIKSVRKDETPLTPPVSKKVLFTKDKSSDESSLSDASKNKQKTACQKCMRGFSFNAHRAICMKCGSNFHFNCISLRKEEYLKVKAVWMCTGCDPGAGASPLTAVQPTDKISSSDIAELMKEMKEFRREMTDMNKDFKNSLEQYSEWVVENGKKIDDVGKQVKEIKEDMNNLHQENVNLKKTVQDLTNKVNYLEQASKENVVEIHGIPARDKEDLLDLVSKVSVAIGFDFNHNMIDNCFRYNTRGADGKPGGIVVRFVRKLDLDIFLQKRKDKRNLNTRDIGFMDGNASPIYVNNSLTQNNRKLLNAARQIKREKQYTFLWVRYGKIFMRKNQGDRFVVIDSMESLSKL